MAIIIRHIKRPPCSKRFSFTHNVNSITACIILTSYRVHKSLRTCCRLKNTSVGLYPVGVQDIKAKHMSQFKRIQHIVVGKKLSFNHNFARAFALFYTECILVEQSPSTVDLKY